MSKHLPKKENKHVKEPARRPAARSAKEPRRADRGRDIPLGLERDSIIETAAALALLIAACILPQEGWLGACIFAVPFAAAAYRMARHALDAILRRDFTDECVLLLIASIAAFAAGEFAAGAAIAVIFRVGKLIEAYAARLIARLNAGMLLTPGEVVHVEVDGMPAERAPRDVAVGDIMLVDVGEMVIIDGVVIDGMSELDAALLSGASESYTVAADSRAYAGCVNVSAPLKIRAERPYEASMPARVNDALANAARYKAALIKRFETFSKYYTPVLAVAAIILAIVPPIFSGEWRLWIGRAALLLCLTGVSLPEISITLAYTGALALLAEGRVIVKGTRFIEALAKAATMVFNKTGTLTDGTYSVAEVAPVGMTEDELLLLAARAEQYSPHPIARGIIRACGAFARDSAQDVKMEEIPGRGVSTIVRGKHILVGNAALLEEQGIECPMPRRRSGAAIHVALNDKYCGYIIVNDRVREGAFDIMEALRVLGVKNSVLLTADVHSVARTVAASLNFEMVKAEQTPDRKISAVEYLLATKPERTSLAVVSDRASDKEALARADVGITLAAAGAHDALDCADVLIMANDLARLPEAMRTARLAHGAAVQNVLAFSAVRVLLIALGIAGGISIIGAALIDLACACALLANAYRVAHKII